MLLFLSLIAINWFHLIASSSSYLKNKGLFLIKSSIKSYSKLNPNFKEIQIVEKVNQFAKWGLENYWE